MKKIILLAVILIVNVTASSAQKCSSCGDCDKSLGYGGLNYNFKTNEIGLNTLFRFSSSQPIYTSIDISKSISARPLEITDYSRSLMPYMDYRQTERTISYLSARVGVHYPIVDRLMIGANIGFQKVTIENTYIWGESLSNYNKGYELSTNLLYDFTIHYRLNWFAVGASIGNQGMRALIAIPLFTE